MAEARQQQAALRLSALSPVTAFTCLTVFPSTSGSWKTPVSIGCCCATCRLVVLTHLPQRGLQNPAPLCLNITIATAKKSPFGVNICSMWCCCSCATAAAVVANPQPSTIFCREPVMSPDITGEERARRWRSRGRRNQRTASHRCTLPVSVLHPSRGGRWNGPGWCLSLNDPVYFEKELIRGRGLSQKPLNAVFARARAAFVMDRAGTRRLFVPSRPSACPRKKGRSHLSSWLSTER